MELIYLDGLSPTTRTGGVLKFLIEQGGVDKMHIGKILINDGLATAELESNKTAKVVKRLDGAVLYGRKVAAWMQRGDQAHFAQFDRWLAMEAEAERKVAADKKRQRDYGLNRLAIRTEDVGLGGRTLVLLAPKNESVKLPYTKLGSGTPILLTEEGTASPRSWRGIVSKVTRAGIELALNQSPESEAGTYAITLASDEIGRQRMQRAMTRAASANGTPLATLRDVLLGEAEAEQARAPQANFIPAAHLNDAQLGAIAFALAAEQVAIIHGPPGTGKTTTLTALILAAVARGDKILACAPSNLAVDNLAARLAAAGANIVRVGHPVRVHKIVRPYALDVLVEQHPDYRRAKKTRKEAAALNRDAGKWKRAAPEKGAKRGMRDEARELFDEARQMETAAIESVMNAADVVLATLTGIDSNTLGQRQFDLCVIDEAGQSTEPASWIPIVRAKRLVLAGDHQQLPPTVISQAAEQAGFGVSLLERLITTQPGLARRLDVQYRMHGQIMGFSSAEFYDDSLIAHDSVAGHLLTDLPSVTAVPITETPLEFIDTAGASYDEEQAADSKSRTNSQEAALAIKKVTQLQENGVAADQIALITPYSDQVNLLRELLPDEIEVSSVDGFQGREKEVIIISLVRSNSDGEIGFLAETRRMNVALTRARRKLIVIGDSATIASDPFFGRFIDYTETHMAYRSVWEEM